MIENILLKLAEDHSKEGFWMYYDRLHNSGNHINHKPLYRVYRKLGLNFRRKSKKRLPARIKEPLEVPKEFCKTWSMDFTHDTLSNSKNFRSFNIIDDYNREVLFIDIDYSLKSSRVLWILRHLFKKHGKPDKIRMDNGPEFIANITKKFSIFHEVEFKYIQPGKPTQNAYIERFNRTYREQVLDAYIFENLEDVREVTEKFINDYNYDRPHQSLNGLSPIQYKILNHQC